MPLTPSPLMTLIAHRTQIWMAANHLIDLDYMLGHRLSMPAKYYYL